MINRRQPEEGVGEEERRVCVDWEGKECVPGTERRTALLGQKEGAGERSERSETGGKTPSRARSYSNSWTTLKGYGLYPWKNGKPAKHF